MRELYFITLDGRPYGIRKDEVSEVREAPAVHRLPLTPAAIAGVAIMNGRSTALADLAVCMGLRPTPAGADRKVLVISGRDDGAGFLVAGGVSGASVPAGDLHPVPEYLRTDDVDTCVVRDGSPVPIINISRLHDRLQEHSSDPLSPSCSAPAPLSGAMEAHGPVRLVTAGDELFAFPGEQLSGPAVRPSGIAAVGRAPRHVRGMVFHNGRVMPVIHVADRLDVAGKRSSELLVTADHAGMPFGLLVQDEQGMLPAESFSVRPLPPVAATGWCAAAVISQGRIVPLLDAGVLVSRKASDDPVAGLAGRYAPDLRFAGAFERTAVEVVEFSLLGVRHALPRNEVEDVLPHRSYRRLPGALPIVIGAAELGGDVLPVLDLALVFGRRSLERPGWRMILVRNGDFRALVITEQVFGERSLPLEVQRKVPINLPHGLVYGCYPEGVAVRLILNVEALAVHFDRALVADLLPALTPEMAEAPAELVISLLPASAAARGTAPGPARTEEAARLPEEEQRRREAEDAARREADEHARRLAEEEAKREAEERAAHEAAERAAREAEEQAARETAARLEQERIEAEAAALALREQNERAAREAAERSAREAEEQAARETAARLEQERIEAEAAALALREQNERAAREADEQAAREAAERSAQKAEEERQRIEAEAQRKRAEEERLRAEAEAKALEEARDRDRREREQQERAIKAAEEQARTAAAEQAKREAEARERAAAEEKARLAEEAARRAEGERLRREAVEAAGKARRAAEERERVLAQAALRADEEAAGRTVYEQAPRDSGRPAISAAAGSAAGPVMTSGRKRAAAGLAGLIALILLLFALAGREVKDSPVPEGTGTAPSAGRQQTGGADEKSGAGSPGATGPAAASTAPARPDDAQKRVRRKEDLVLTVPADRPLESDIYIVKKGDTLWHISKRFTGNPFNYPRVASDNRIANPDLIFPGQRITLRK